MVQEGRAQYADPSSMIRAGAMLLEHIGYTEQGQRLTRALDICGQHERKVVTTGRSTGATAQEYGEYILETMKSSKVDSGS